MTARLALGFLLPVVVAGASTAQQPVPMGDEFQVNTYTTGIQDGPTVLADGADGFFVFWDSSGSAGTDDFSSVQGQRYQLPDIFTDGFESGDTSAWSNTVP